MKKGYILNKQTGKKESYFELKEIPQETEQHKFVEFDGMIPILDKEEIVLTEEQQREILINKKIRSLAEEELKKEGKLNQDGSLKKEI